MTVTDTRRTEGVIEHISEKTVRRIKKHPPTHGNQVVWDDEVVGFGVRITSSGAVSFVLRYVTQGRERRLTIAKHPDLSPGAARSLAIQLRGDVAHGQDPLAEREKLRRGVTVSALCQRYLSDYAQKRKKASSVSEDRRLIDKRIKPKLGALRTLAVTRQDIVSIHNGLSGTPYEANRTLALLSKMFNVAELWGLKPDGSNPCRHVRRFPEKKRNGAFSHAEVARLGEALRQAESRGRETAAVLALLKFLIFTGCRLSEARALRWEWIDWERASIAFPDSKTGPKVHRLGRGALQILSNRFQERTSASPYVFPAPKNRSCEMPVGTVEHCWQRLREQAGLEGKRLHDFRHTRGTWAAETGANAFLVRDILSHKNVGTTDRYVKIGPDPVRHLNDALDKKLETLLKSEPLKSPVTDQPTPSTNGMERTNARGSAATHSSASRLAFALSPGGHVRYQKS
jgi:integrase